MWNRVVVLEALDAVDWPRLLHAYGSAADVPDMLRSLVSADGESKQQSIGGRDDPVRLVFDATPGHAIVVGLCDLGDRFRLVANEVEVVPPDEPLPKLPVARAI